MKPNRREVQQAKRHRRVRRKVSGSAERPRLSIYKSLRHLHAQVINDDLGHTIVSASTTEQEFKKDREGKSRKNTEAATALGALVAKRARQHGVTKVVFDRSGYRYHGRLKSFAEAAREAGLEF